ncbi:MAG: retention module-containing protein [Agarilytica sp.]
MTNSTSQVVAEVVGKIAGTHGDIRVTQADGTIAVAREGAELLMGTTIETFGSSIVVVKLTGFKPISLGHDTKIVVDQALLDSMKDELEGSLDEQIDFDALAQAIESGENLEEMLPATAAGGDATTSADGASNGNARFELTNDSVSPESGFETSETQTSETESFLDDRDYFNNPPIALAMPSLAVNQDANVVIDLSLGFYEGDEGQSLNFTVSDLPEGLSFDSETNLITGAATNDAAFAQDGIYQILVTAQDDSGAPNNSASNQFVLQVNNVNDAPLAGAPFELGQINEDGSITFSVELLLDGASDIDQNDVLEVSDLQVLAGEGLVSDSGDGSFTFTPNANWYGDVEFGYNVVDGNGGAAANSGVLNVASVNDLPVVTPDFPLNISPETTVNVDVLANDFDVDGDELTLINVSAENGDVVIEADGSLSYTPFDDFVGNDSIQYTVSDSNGGEVAASVDVAVVYNPGIVTVDPLVEQETTLPSFTGSSANIVGNILLNIDGADYQVLPIKGGSWSFALPEGAELADGEYTIVATGWDALGNPAMASQTLVVDVEMPSISIDEQAVITDSTPTISGSSANTDGDFSLELNGNTYSVTPEANGDWRFTSPLELEDGEYTLTVSGGDAQGNAISVSSDGLIDAQLPQITINDQHEAASTPMFSGNAEHIEGDLTLSVSGEDYAVTVNENGAWSFTLPQDVVLEDGDYTVEVSGNDPQGNSTSVSDSFIVDEQLPVIVIDAVPANPGGYVGTDQPVVSGSSNNIEGDITVTIGDDEYTVTPEEDGSWSIEIPEGGSLSDGEHTIIVEGGDGQGNEVSEQQDFVVDAVDDVPTITGDLAAVVDEDSAAVLLAGGDLNAVGGDPGEELFVAAQSNGSFGVFSIDEQGVWEYQADNSQTEIQSLSVGDSLQESFIVTNADGVTTETVIVTINGANDLPTVDAAIVSSSTEDDASYSIDLLAGASDVDSNDTLNISEFSIVGGANGASLIGNQLSIDPNAFNDLAVGESATINFNYFVTDNQGGGVAQSGSVTVTGQNDAPAISQGIDLGVVPEDASFDITSTQLLNGASDVDGDALSIENLSLSQGEGLLQDNGNGTWTYTPSENWNGGAIFNFEVNDGHTSVANTATLQITEENDAPAVSAIDLGGIEEDGSLLILESDLLNGASDVDGDELSIENLSLSQGEGGLQDNGNGTWTYTPSENWNGGAVFNFEVNDGHTSVANTATLHITEENDAPVVGAIDLGSIEEDGSLLILESDLLNGASDVDGDELSIENLSLSQGEGGLQDNGNGTWTYTPSENWNGGAVFNFEVNDGHASVANTATLHITEENDAPVVGVIDLGSIEEDGSLLILESDLLNGASDVDGDELSIENLSLSQGEGGLQDNGNGTWTYTPSENWNGDVSFDFDVNDGVTSVANTASLEVFAQNDNPQVDAAISESVSEDAAAFSIDLLAGASDPDTNDTLNVSDVEISGDGASAVSLNGNTLEVNPAVYNALRESDSPINISIDYNIVDGNGGVVVQSASLSVSGVNDIPTITGDVSGEVVEDSAEVLSVNGELSADGGDAGEDLFVAETLHGNFGDLEINAEGEWEYNADNNQAEIQALTGNDETLSENFIVTNADGETTQNIEITLRGNESLAPEVIVQDGEIDQSLGSIDKEFVAGDYDFSSQDDASDASGLAIENMLVEFASDITLTFISEAAGFDNTLGWYSVGEDGSINDVNIVWANGNDLTPGESITLNNVSEGEIGFFVIPNGYASAERQEVVDAMLAGDGLMRFETSRGELADVNDSGVTLSYYSEGDVQNPSGSSLRFPVTVHSTHGNLNRDFITHAHSGLLDGDANTLVIGFEDQIDWPSRPGSSDWDLQDMVFSIQMRSAENFVSDIAPELQIVDDGTELSAATVNLALAREGDFLILSDDTEVLADAYGIVASYDSATRTMSLSGEASIAQYEEILSSVQLMNDEEFGNAPRQIEFSVTDADGLESEVATVNLDEAADYEYTENDFVAGNGEANELAGLLGDDVIFGAQGNDALSGGEGSDTFIWVASDEAGNAEDRISDFESGLGGDVLNFADLLQGENNDAVTLDGYFNFESDGTDTTISVDVEGDASGADMSVVLEGIDLTVLGGDQTILQSLLDNGNLITD